jgi:hypothetical protein
MAGVFQPDVFQSDVFQVDTTPGTVCTGTAWGGSWGASWLEAWGGTCAVPGTVCVGGAWAESWADSWHESWGSDCSGTTPPAITPPTIPPGGGSLWKYQHRGSLYWKRYQEELKRGRKKLPKKKLDLLEDLDEHLLELKARFEEVPVEEIDLGWVSDLRRAEAFAEAALVADYTVKDIQARLIIVREMIREMDDEEAILLAIH